MTDQPIDDLLADEPSKPSDPDTAGLDLSIDLDIFADSKNEIINSEGINDLDIGALAAELEADRNAPAEVIHHPVTGEIIHTSDLSKIVRHAIELKSLKQSIEMFENEIRKAALALSTGETKTRRLSAEVDGEIRTLEIHLPDDHWSETEFGQLHAWCVENTRVTVLGPLWRRFVREKVKVERSPVKKEIKKLVSEVFPEGLMSEFKERLLKINKGPQGRLPTVKVAGESMSEYERKRFGEGDEE